MRVVGFAISTILSVLLLAGTLPVAAQSLLPFDTDFAESAELGPQLRIESLIGMGNAYAEEGTHWRALAAYSEAAEISRRADGLFNETLISLLDLMAGSAAANGDPVLAGRYRLEAHDAEWRLREQDIREISRDHGRNSEAYVFAKIELAQWLLRQRVMVTTDDRGNRRVHSWHYEANDIFDEVEKQIERELDHDPELRVNALRLMARDSGRPLYLNYRIRYFGVPSELLEAKKFLERLDEPDPVLHASVLMEIADSQLANRPEAAHRDLVAAWHMLGNAENGEVLQAEYFDQPRLLALANPQMPAGLTSAAPDASLAQAELVFVVNETGRVSGIRVVSAEPAWADDVAYASIATSLFRPRLQNGEVVPSAGSYTWSMRFDPEVAKMLGLMAD